jgi:adenylosuccinate lyase
MITDDDHIALVSQMEALLTELDRLQLPLVAVHVDFALRRLEEVIAGIASNDESIQN